MKILVISDIHANLTALQAVLEEAGEIDSLWCLGDLVGYGPDPNECVELIRSHTNSLCVLGNHDAAALGQIGVESFNRDASISALWTLENLTDENKAFLKDLPQTRVLKDFDVTLAHGSPRNPVWEYLLDIFTASDNFGYFETQFCFVGHTHLPLAYEAYSEKFDIRLRQFRESENLKLNNRAILNPGSVGQPRDHDARASFAIFYPEERIWSAHRVNYDYKQVQERILKKKLPKRQAERIAEGW